MSLRYFAPRRIPPEIGFYSGPPKQLAVGSPGKLGGLRLKLSRDDAGKTVLTDVWRQVPLQTLKPFYYDEHQPNLAIIYILNPTGGNLQGDRSRIDVALETQCKAHLTTQAATKLYRMNTDYATQVLNITLGRGAYLEYLPDQIIPYRDSRFYQEVNVRMAPGSAFVYWEMLTSGRSGRERFDFDIFYSKLTIVNQRNQPLLSDTLLLEPKKTSLDGIGLLNGRDTIGNFYVVSERASQSLVDKLHAVTKDESLLVGVSPPALTQGVVARVVGPMTRHVRGVLQKLWNEARVEILGSPAPRIRK